MCLCLLRSDLDGLNRKMNQRRFLFQRSQSHREHIPRHKPMLFQIYFPENLCLPSCLNLQKQTQNELFVRFYLKWCHTNLFFYLLEVYRVLNQAVGQHSESLWITDAKSTNGNFDLLNFDLTGDISHNLHSYWKLMQQIISHLLKVTD